MKTTVLSLAVLNALAFSVCAAAGGPANPGYLSVESTGSIVIDSSGNCVRTTAWSEKATVETCRVVRTVTLESDALFAFGSAFFNREAQPGALQKFAQRVTGLRSVEAVHIVGHTDNMGPPAYNQALSERRAGSVKDYLVKSGVDPAKITILGMGERSPAADNATREGRARNRRVVIMFKGLLPDQ
jgi:OmpA-OmpF porin, OOP family